jgi:hypothetical protein
MQWQKILKNLNWFLIAYLAVSLFVRFYNYQESLYFIYDIGRDSLVFKSMAEGDLKLTGPTTGLKSFYLGPLWYYIGLPGYLIGNGSPYILQLWYILLAWLSIPLFWILSHRLFGNTKWAKLAAILLAFIPGSILGTNKVWNPMLALPLMTAAILCLLEARKSKVHLVAGMLFIALTLQAEFAYAIFFLVSFILLLPWLRGKWEWKTFAAVVGVTGITLIPQIVFELIHKFAMTKAIFTALQDPDLIVPFSQLWVTRPQQMLTTMVEFFSRSQSTSTLTLFAVSLPMLVAGARIIKAKSFEWKFMLLGAVLPYAFYMFWRGNYGNFFDYYVTSHFIFLVPLLVYGLRFLYGLLADKFKPAGYGLVAAVTALLLYNGVRHIDGYIVRANNQAGLRVVETSVLRLYEWSLKDAQKPPVFRIYTPNIYTEQYDYMSWWLARNHGFDYANTVQSDKDGVRYVLYEPATESFRRDFFEPWYLETTGDFVKMRSEKIGVLTVETWVREDVADKLVSPVQ